MVSIESSWRSFKENGDESFFADIYNHQVNDLLSYGISLGFQQETCKDAIQDTFYKLYISRKNLFHIRNITAYIFKSFKHRLIDLSRKKSRIEEVSFEAITEFFTTRVTILDNIIDNENAELLKNKVITLLDDLTPNQREIVYLRYSIGLEHKEIADILNIHEESSRKLLHRTITKLRQKATTKPLHNKG